MLPFHWQNKVKRHPLLVNCHEKGAPNELKCSYKSATYALKINGQIISLITHTVDYTLASAFFRLSHSYVAY